MTRGEMRSMLRRQVQEDTAAQWTDATLNSYLNIGLQFMQTAVLQHNPEAFLEEDRTDFYTADNGLIPKPIGCIRVKQLKVMYPGDTAYTVATKVRNDQIDTAITDYSTSAFEDSPIWAPYGQWMRVWPEPSSNVTNGVYCIFVPTLTMGSDSDVPLLNLHLHEGIVYKAKSVALGDTDEEADAAVNEALDKRLSVVISRIPLYYNVDGPPDKMDFDVDHEAGWV